MQTKILILSDTHRETKNWQMILEKEQPDAVIHAGDSCLYMAQVKKLFKGPVHIVRGNCDYGDEFPIEDCFDIAGHRFFVTHGHYQGLPELRTLERKAKEHQADVVVFGHTHVLFEQHDYGKGILYLNPGSLDRPRDIKNFRESYMIMTIDESGKMDVEIKYTEKYS